MPCYEVRTMSVEFKAENRQLLNQAIKAMNVLAMDDNEGLRLWGGAVVLNLKAGTATVREGYQDQLNALKRQYSKECVKAAAKKMQWAVKFQGQQATVNKVNW